MSDELDKKSKYIENEDSKSLSIFEASLFAGDILAKKHQIGTIYFLLESKEELDDDSRIHIAHLANITLGNDKSPQAIETGKVVLAANGVRPPLYANTHQNRIVWWVVPV